MATKTDLMGFGVPPLLAQRQGTTPIIATCGGTSAGSATQIGGDQYLTMITGSNGGSGLKLPQVTGDNGCLLGDDFIIQNNLGANIVVYAANNAAGSTVTIYANATSAGGLTGMSVATGQAIEMWPVTVSTWVGIKSSV